LVPMFCLHQCTFPLFLPFVISPFPHMFHDHDLSIPPYKTLESPRDTTVFLFPASFNIDMAMGQNSIILPYSSRM
jgi:hypothetical protein